MERGPRKIKVDYGRKDMYKNYSKKNNDAVSASIYSAVLNSFNKEVSKGIIEEAFEFLLPKRLGTIRIKKYKTKYKIDKQGKIIGTLSPNWMATKELWNNDSQAKENKKMVYHTNEHSDGYQYKWHFSNYRSNCINKSAYCFIPSRTNKRRLAELIKDEEFNGDYFS